MGTENKDNKVKYKYGQSELDLDHYIYNLGYNVSRYLDGRTDWSPELKLEFLNSYSKYMQRLQELLNGTSENSSYIDDFGNFYDPTGILNNDDNDSDNGNYYYDKKGKQINLSDYDSLKDKKKKNYQSFNANREVVRFFNLVGKRIVDGKGKEKASSKPIPKEKFSHAKHGFLNWWANFFYPTDAETPDLSPILELDQPVNGVRETTERRKRFKTDLGTYRQQAEKYKDYDFSETSFGNYDNFVAAIDNLETVLGTDNINNIRAAYYRLGGNDTFFNDFFTDKENPEPLLVSNPYIEQAKQAGYNEEAAAVVARELQEASAKLSEDVLFNNYLKELQSQNLFVTSLPISISHLFNPDELSEIEDLNDKTGSNLASYTLSFMDKYLESTNLANLLFDNRPNSHQSPTEDFLAEYLPVLLLDSSISQFKLSNYDSAIDTSAKLDTWLHKLGDGRTSLEFLGTAKGWYALPWTIDFNTNTFYGYNPEDQSWNKFSIFDPTVPAYIQLKIRENWKIERNKEGGVLKFQNAGTLTYTNLNSSYSNRFKNKEESEQGEAKLDNTRIDRPKLEKLIKKTGRTKEQLEAGSQKHDSSMIPFDPDNTYIENARLFSLYGDLASLVASFVPGVGTAVSLGTGLSSTLSNLVADIGDPSVSGWGAAGNLGLNLASDAAGLIPGIGSTGKVAKVTKTVATLAPLIISGLSAYSNGAQYKESFKRLIDGLSLTVDDWKNMLLGMQLLIGAGRYASGVHTNRQVQKRRAMVEGGAPTIEKTVLLGPAVTKSRNPLLLTKNDYDDLVTIKTVEGQNDFLKAKGILEELTELVRAKPEWEGLKRRSATPVKKGERVVTNSNSNTNITIPEYYYESYVKPTNNNEGVTAIRPKKWKDDYFYQNWLDNKKFGWVPYWAKTTDVEVGKTVPLNSTSSNRVAAETTPIRQSSNEVDIPEALPILNESPSTKTNKSKMQADDKSISDYNTKHKKQQPTKFKKVREKLNPKTGKYETKDDRRLRGMYSPQYTTIESQRKLSQQIESLIAELPQAVSPQNLTTHNIEIGPKSSIINDRMSIIDIVNLRERQRLMHLNKPSLNTKKGRRYAKAKEEYEGLWLSLLRLLDEAKLARKNMYKKHQNGGQINFTKLRKGGVLKFQNAGVFPILYSFDNPDVTNSVTFRSLQKYNNPYMAASFTDYDRIRHNIQNGTLSYEPRNGKEAADLIASGNLKYDPEGKADFDKSMEYLGWLGRLHSDPVLAELWANQYRDLQVTDDTHYKDWWNADKSFNFENFKSSKIFTDGINGIGHDFIKGNVYKIDGEDGYYSDIQEGYELISTTPDSSNPYYNLYTLKKKPVDPVLESALQKVAVALQAKDPTEIRSRYEKGKGITKPADLEVKPLMSESGSKEWIGELLNNPTLTYALPRALYADRMNRKITDLALESTVPLLKDTYDIHRPVYGDLRAKMEGLLAAGRLSSMASKPITSDGNLQAAMLFEAALKGLDYINAGNKADDLRIRETSELAWQLEKDNITRRNDVSNFNRALMWAANKDKSKIEQAYLSKKFTNWDIFAKQVEYEARQKLDKQKSLEDQYALKDIKRIAREGFADYAKPKNADDILYYLDMILVFNEVLYGTTTISELMKPENKERFLLYKLAKKLYDERVSEMLRRYHRLPKLLAKDGTKLEIAKLRNKAKNADRFKKQVVKALDRNEKALDRLAKSMYGLIKSKDIK